MKKALLILIAVVVPLVIILVLLAYSFSCDELDVLAEKRAKQIVEYIQKHYKENNKYPDINKIPNKKVRCFLCSTEIVISYGVYSKSDFVVYYYEKPLGPSYNYSSEKNEWYYQE